MQLIGIVLLLVSMGLVVAPIGAVVVIYRDDLTGLVIPPEIRGVMNGDTGFILNDNVGSVDGGDGSNANSIFDSFVTPTFVGATIDQSAKTFNVRVNVTNPLNYDLTLNTLSVEVLSPDGQELASINIGNPYTMPSGESTIVQVNGAWTQAGENYIIAHSSDSSITIALANMVVDVNGIKVERSEPLTVIVPLSLSGVTFTG
jgi:hypothetical protein